MKTVMSVFAALLLVIAATPALAYVVEVTTAVSLTDVNDEAQLKDALKAAVDGVLTETIAFKPTLVALTNARVVGERLYVRLLIADEEGERTLGELNGHGGDNEDDEGNASPAEPEIKI